MDRFITPSELHSLDDKELCALFNKVCDALYASEPDSPERYTAYASLENIRREIARRAARPMPPRL
jgi:hypothetical protein